MMTDNTQKIVVKENNFIPLFHLTTVVFVVLKLSGTVDWSWWLVLLPSLIPLGITAALIITAAFVFLLALIVEMITNIPYVRKKREQMSKLRWQRMVDRIKNENKK